MHTFIGFIWEIITFQLSNLQYWQINKMFLVPLLGDWVGEGYLLWILKLLSLQELDLAINREKKWGEREKRRKRRNVKSVLTGFVKRRNCYKASSPSGPAQGSRWPHFKVQTLVLYLLQTSYNASFRCYYKKWGKIGHPGTRFSGRWFQLQKRLHPTASRDSSLFFLFWQGGGPSK